MRTIIIEDNLAARRNIICLLNDHCSDIKLIGEATTVTDGLKLIINIKPDLIFLDIEMPDGTGFELLQKLPNINFQIIFISSHEKYALKAIKFSALDYLLKPFDPEELIIAVQKAKSEMNTHETQQKISTLTHNVSNNSGYPEKIILKDKYGIQIVTINDIYHLQANGSYTEFFIKDQNSLITSKHLKEYQNLLPTRTFFRCHQSFIINLNHLTRYDKKEGDFLILKNGSKVPLASRKKEGFLKIITS